jgi:hypothetical protein
MSFRFRASNSSWAAARNYYLYKYYIIFFQIFGSGGSSLRWTQIRYKDLSNISGGISWKQVGSIIIKKIKLSRLPGPWFFQNIRLGDIGYLA